MGDIIQGDDHFGEDKPHLFNLIVTPASCNSIKTCLTYFICASVLFKNIAFSNRYTSVSCHWTVEKDASIGC